MTFTVKVVVFLTYKNITIYSQSVMHVMLLSSWKDVDSDARMVVEQFDNHDYHPSDLSLLAYLILSGSQNCSGSEASSAWSLLGLSDGATMWRCLL